MEIIVPNDAQREAIAQAYKLRTRHDTCRILNDGLVVVNHNASDSSKSRIIGQVIFFRSVLSAFYTESGYAHMLVYEGRQRAPEPKKTDAEEIKDLKDRVKALEDMLKVKAL